VFEANARAAPPGDDSLWFTFHGDELLVREREDGVPAPLTRKGLPAIDPRSVIALGALNGRPAFAAQLDPAAVVPDGCALTALRPLLARLDGPSLEAASLAAQLSYFARNYRFCARCAGALRPHEASRARVCDGCGHEWYPRVSPCTIVLVHDGDRVLMTRQPRYPEGMYGLVAGFVEASESLEACARRETLEECGVLIDELRYVRSQPWPFPHQLMVGYVARYAGGELVVDRGELEDARWFHRDALPKLPPRFSIARELIDAWARGELLTSRS
jgi:NAD+ diphosphatase